MKFKNVLLRLKRCDIFSKKCLKLHIIGAGSLLEFTLNAADFSMPVGRVEFQYLYPLSFSEMLGL